MSDNLPPGVTGNEWQIAGPTASRGEHELDVEHECPDDEVFTGAVFADMEFMVSCGTVYETYYWSCPRCGQDGETEKEASREDFIDPDADRD